MACGVITWPKQVSSSQQLCSSLLFTPPPRSSLPLVSLSVFVWGLFVCEMWGEQPDSPESRQQIPNTRLLTSVSQDVHSDVWLLTVHPGACQEGGEKKEKRRLIVETAMDCAVFCLMGGWLTAHCTSVVCIVLNRSTVLCVRVRPSCVCLVITCAVLWLFGSVIKNSIPSWLSPRLLLEWSLLPFVPLKNVCFLGSLTTLLSYVKLRLFWQSSLRIPLEFNLGAFR